TANQLRHMLAAAWSERPMTTLMVTHNLHEAILLADRIVLLSPRPSHVTGVFLIRIPREMRNEQVRSDLMRSFREKFPDYR
ncbi:MAG: ABC transporter ATP-binding protein, partial [Rhizobiaceae bacterium]|nr:ABC transporter ATP-binding protein [Rhizobiaceae bacterium]